MVRALTNKVRAPTLILALRLGHRRGRSSRRLVRARSISHVHQPRSARPLYPSDLQAFATNMHSDDDVQMEADAPVAWPITNGKGKGKQKATEPPPDASHDPENLPW